MVAMNTQKIYGGKKSNALSENKYNASCMFICFHCEEKPVENKWR